MSVDELKEATLQAIRQTYEETKKPSSLKILYKKVDGLNNRNFYKIFENVEEAHELARVPYDKSRREKMTKVRKKRGTKSAKRDKKVDDTSNVALMDPSAQLSKEIISCLYDLQGILGADSIFDALETAYRDEVSAAKYKMTCWGEYSNGDEEFTFGKLVDEILDNVNDLKIDSRISHALITDCKKTITKLKDGEDAHYDEGYENGKNDHVLLVPCGKCDKPCIIVPGSEIHQDIIDFLNDSIIHKNCPPRY